MSFDLVQPPTFYENEDELGKFTVKMTTVEPNKSEVEKKKCPFLRNFYALSGNTDTLVSTATLKNATFIETEFQSCLKEECALWNSFHGACGLQGKR